jgi:hypothetical protein
MTALIGLVTPASASHVGTLQNVTLTVSDNGLSLAVDHYHGYTFTLGVADSINYGIQVITPSTVANIDVYFFTASGLAAYQTDPPATAQAITALENQRQFGGTFSAASGAITVIIDNVNGTGATPTGAVTVQVAMTRNGGPPSGDVFSGIIAAGILLCVGLIAIVVIVIFVIVYLITRSNRPAMPPPMPPYMPPQQPWPPPQPPQQPPQGGAPPEQWPPQNP